MAYFVQNAFSNFLDKHELSSSKLPNINEIKIEGLPCKIEILKMPIKLSENFRMHRKSEIDMRYI